MKIIIDNNIALDALLGRQPFNEAAEKILIACADTHIGYLSVNCLTDIYYILRKSMDVSSVKAAIKKLMELLVIVSINDEDCMNALSLQIDDFEDALVVICGKNVNADFIVTRDNKFINITSPIPVLSPDKMLEIITDAN
jgi:predicted nucleic acid-binding protein